MGEAFKRARAAPFQHQRSRPYQALVERDLLRISRTTESRFEVNLRLTNSSTGLQVGSRCVLRASEGDHDLLHGNMVVGRLPPEARVTVAACKQGSPSLNGIIPCRVTRLGLLGGVSLELDVEDHDNAH